MDLCRPIQLQESGARREFQSCAAGPVLMLEWSVAHIRQTPSIAGSATSPSE
jgi:hypothetical protein